jgi:hypothetical protein
MPHTNAPQDGGKHTPHSGTHNPEGERPVSHFDKRRSSGHSGYNKTHAPEHHKPRHTNAATA